MSSILKVNTIQDTDGNNIINENANTITIGASGDTITIPSGATIDNQGTSSGFASIAWQSSIVTAATLTAEAGKGYWIDTTSNACTVTLPGSASVGDQIILTDYARNWATNAVTIDPNSLNFQGRTTPQPVYNTNGQSVDLVYSGATKGWIPNSDDDVTFETEPSPYNIEFLVIGGGGAGGYDYGGGGGAGGFRTSTQSVSFATVITVTVGDGGAGGGGAGASGSNSLISGSGLTTITSAGGGGGATPVNPGISGGSGGGGARNSGGSGNTPSTSPSQGNDGGAGGTGAPSYSSGGGGGAGAVGGAGSNSTPGAGGNGTASSITGSSVTYAGGGGGSPYNTGNGASGGTGGGGRGGDSGTYNGVAGTANTGGGGGAGGFANPRTGNSGGKGVIILSMPDANYSGTTTGSPTVATGVSGKTVLTFTGTGSYTA